MSNEVDSHELAPNASRGASRSSKVTKLVQAAALAAVLVPLGSIAAEGTTCTFRASSGGSTCDGAGAEGNLATGATWSFTGYEVTVDFAAVFQPFKLEVIDNPMTQEEFDARTGGSFSEFSIQSGNPALSNYVCLPLVDPSTAPNGDFCRDFQFVFSPTEAGAPSASPATGNGYWSGYAVSFHWDYNTNSTYPFPGVTLVHNIGAIRGDGFDEDMCIQYGCLYDPDPGISTMDTDFASIAPAFNPAAAVPEPASMFLLGTGLTGLLYRRRRKN